jgi:type III restriction enzyme
MDGAERLYLVVETKSSLFMDDLRDQESAKNRLRKSSLRIDRRRIQPGEIEGGSKITRSFDNLVTTLLIAILRNGQDEIL